jgi:bacteriorhodopsin
MYEYSFYVTYVLLITTGTITMVEALRTNSQTIRNVLNLETCISIVAAYFYSLFIERIHDSTDITALRYMDWSITTPMMLISLILSVQMQYSVNFIRLKNMMYVLFLNYAMLLCGYLGEMGIWNKLYSNLVGFVFFISLFTYIYRTFFKNCSMFGKIVLWTYIVIWSMYGLVYFLPYDEKMLGYNVLDLMAKCLMGIFLWMYFSKIIKI